MGNKYKYPRTFHLPWSPGKSDDDRVLNSVSHFVGKEVVVTEKVDGECTTIYSDHIHARSVDSKNHPSRTWVKTLQGQIGHNIPENFRICGENVFAKHSIHYHNLETYFYVFNIWDGNTCLSWDDMLEYAKLLGLSTVEILYRGLWDEKKIHACWTGKSATSPGDEQEGYVVRRTDGFSCDDFCDFVGKYVRKNHVQTSEHWLVEEMVPNLLRGRQKIT